MVDSKNAEYISMDYDTRIIQIRLNTMDINSFMLFASTLKTKYFRFQASRPRKPRTTGKESQNHAINGYCQQIAVATGNDFDTVKITAKYRAISRGYPFETMIIPGGNNTVPLSESKIDTIQAGYLIDELKQIAAELNITLKEK